MFGVLKAFAIPIPKIVFEFYAYGGAVDFTEINRSKPQRASMTIIQYPPIGVNLHCVGILRNKPFVLNRKFFLRYDC